MNLVLVVYKLFLLFFMDTHVYEYNFSYTINLVAL